MLKKSAKISTNIISIENKKWLLLLILVLMSTTGLVGSDVYLPTLPAIAKALGKDVQSIQFTLGIYLVGLSIGQLFFGFITDHYGRKKPLIAGMALYFIASILCSFSHSYLQMLICRFLQAIGACSGLIIGRAIVGDLFNIREAGKIFSTIFLFVGMSPAISPVIGGFIGFYLGWQSTFIFIAFFAGAVAMLTILFLPETLDQINRQPLKLGIIFRTYPKLLVNKKFLIYALAPCIAYVAYFGYLAQSPFIFHSYGHDEKAIGTFYITLSITYVIGNLLGKKLLNHCALDKVLGYGFLIFNFGGMLLFISGLVHLPLFVMVVAISVVTFGNGFLIPLGTAGVVGSFATIKGYASGLLGFLQLGCASLSSSLVGGLTHSVLGLGVYIFIATLFGMTLFFSVIKNIHTRSETLQSL